MSSQQALTERVEAAHRELIRMRRRFQRGSWITVIVSIALLVLLVGYFAWGYTMLSEFRDQPDRLAALAGDMLDQQIPEVRNTIEAQVNQNATVWAEQVSQQVVAAIPSVRVRLEDLALAQSDTLIEKFNVMGAEQFRRLVDENRSTIRQGFAHLKENDELSEQVVTLMEDALEKELQVDMRDQAEALTEALREVNERLTRLNVGKDLSPEEKIHRKILMIGRRMIMEQFDPDELAKIDKKRAEQRAIRLEDEDTAVADQPAKPAEDDGKKAVDKTADKPKDKKAAVAKADDSGKGAQKADKADPSKKGSAEKNQAERSKKSDDKAALASE